MGGYVLSPLEESVLRALRNLDLRFLTIYQLAVEVDDYDVGQLQSTLRALRRRRLVTGDDDRGWGLTGIGDVFLVQLDADRARARR